MKKILLIFAIGMLSLSLTAQTKTVRGTLAPLTTDISTNTSDISSTNTNVTELTNGTLGVVDWTLTLDGDTAFMSFGGTTLKVLAIQTEEIDVIAPTISSAEVGTVASDTVVIVFSEAMDTDSIPTGISITEDDVAYGIGTPIFSNTTTLHIPLDSVAESERLYNIDYARPGVSDFQDVAGNKLLSFTNLQATNNVSLASSVYAYMLFEGDDTDSMGVMTFTWTGSELYRSTGSPPQGSESTSAAAGAAMTTAQTHDLENIITFAGWFNGGNDENSAQRTLWELDGIEIWFDYTDGAQYLEGTIGGQTFSSSLIGDETAEFKWTHLAVTYDGVGNGVNGYARTYLNGANVSSDSLVGLAADANGLVSIAWDGVDFPFYGDWDDVHFYKSILSDANVDTLYNNPGIPIGGNTDPPIPGDSVEVLFEESWGDFSVTALHSATTPAGIPNDSLEAHLENFFYLGSDDANDPDKADNADIVLFDGSNALKSWYLEGQCCTGSASQSGFANGGTGIHTESYITNAITYYSEVYLSYNVYVESSFINPEGYKAPGMRTVGATASESASRLMFLNYSAVDGDLNPSYYTYANWTSPSFNTTWGSVNVRANAKDYDLSKGTWVNVTLRCYIGTERGEDGRVEMFFDGIYYGQAVSGVPFRDTGDPTGWRLMSLETFMGGGSIDYLSPRDQWMIHDEFVVFRFTDGADVVSGSTPSAVDRDISGTLRNISSLNFPRN